MPKTYKNRSTGEVKPLEEWVVKALDPVIIDGKKHPNGGWEPTEEVSEDAQSVLDSTKPLSRSEKAAKNAEAKTFAKSAQDAVSSAQGFIEAEEYDAAKEFVEAAEKAAQEATEAATAGGAKKAKEAAEAATQAATDVATAYAEAMEGAGEEDEDLL